MFYPNDVESKDCEKRHNSNNMITDEDLKLRM